MYRIFGDFQLKKVENINIIINININMGPMGGPRGMGPPGDQRKINGVTLNGVTGYLAFSAMGAFAFVQRRASMPRVSYGWPCVVTAPPRRSASETHRRDHYASEPRAAFARMRRRGAEAITE